MENIDVVFYINLEHRTDRKEHFLSEIKKLCPDESKVVRIDAIRNEIGIIGCVESHLKVMKVFEEHPEWNTCAIFEDDFTFSSSDVERNNAYIRLAVTTFPEWDAISLAYNHIEKDFTVKDTHEPYVKRVVKHLTSSGYLLTKKFMPILNANFMESLQGAKLYGVSPEFPKYSFDLYWHSIQGSANWYCVSPALGYQYGSYSDIQNQFTDYKC